MLAADDAQSPGNKRYAFPAPATGCGAMLRAKDVAAMEIGGWDTRVSQVPRLARVLKELDAGLAGLKDGLGPAWAQTAALAIMEFSRTVRVNGTKGTDHGTAPVGFVPGGPVAGGRVLADWRGLGGKLLENRDLQPTCDLRSVAKGLLVEHLDLSQSALNAVFPDSGAVTPMRHLVVT